MNPVPSYPSKLLSAFVVLLPVSIAAAGDTSHVAPPEQLADLPARWRQAVQDFHIGGMAIGVVKDDKVIMLETIGFRDPISRAPVTADTPFYLASCTKAFTATAIMQLVEQGKVDLDAPVQTYLPRFELASEEATKSINVRDLLSHGQGLQSSVLAWLEAFTGEITDDRFYLFLKNVKPTGAFRYSNLNYTLAGRIIESVSGLDWKTYHTEHIYKPLGLTRTTSNADAMYSSGTAALPTDAIEGKLILANRKNNTTMHAAGGNGASIKDMITWLRFNLGGDPYNQNPILSKESLDQMQRIHSKQNRNLRIPGQKRTGYGFGWNVGDYKGHTILEHGGGYTGCSVALSFLPEQNIGVAVLCNSGGSFPPIFTADVLDRLLDISPTDLLPQQKKGFDRWMARRSKLNQSRQGKAGVFKNHLSQPAQKYMGTYTNESWGTVRISLANCKLNARVGTLPFQLIFNGKNSFVAMVGENSSSPGKFELDPSGQPSAIVIGWDDNDGDVRFTKN